MKKIIKKKAVNPVAKKIAVKDTVKNHLGFLGLIFLFSAFSLYGIISFFISTNNYIDSLKTSVSVSSNELIASVPTECLSCPLDKIQTCSDFCVYTDINKPDTKVTMIFTDVDSNHKNAVAIEYLFKAGIINGYDDGSFKPENTLNRAELLTILINAVNADLSGGPYENCFIDVQQQWFAPFVCYAKLNGWVSGYINGKFMPADIVTKSAALKMTLNAFKFKIEVGSDTASPFSDVSPTDWFYPYVMVGLDLGVIKSAPTYFPQKAITRGEFAQLVYDVMQLTNNDF